MDKKKMALSADEEKLVLEFRREKEIHNKALAQAISIIVDAHINSTSQDNLVLDRLQQAISALKR